MSKPPAAKTMNRRSFLASASQAALAATGGAALLRSRQARAGAGGDGGEKKPKKLNFVFILIDDLGWTDVACYGSRFYETPGVDRLAKMGMRFTNGYAACTVCSPTRASILTGKYPARLHLTDWIAGHKRPWAKLKVPDWTMYLPHEEVTIAEALKPLGYATCFIGKWHLGPQDYWPKTQGFDVNIGGYSAGQPPTYFAPYRIPTMPDGPKGEYLTDRHADDAEKFLDGHVDKPFLLYLSTYCVHTPLQAKKDLIEKYKAKAEAKPDYPQNNPVYGAMVDSMSQCVDRLLNKLEALKLTDRTVIMFIGDNGGLIGNPKRPVTSNLGLRAGKGSAYEGGVREPFLVYWPGVTKPGSVCDEPVISVDFYPTILEIAGAKGDPAHNRNVDGESLVPLLKGTGKLKRDGIYWHYPHYHPGGATPYGAVRQGDLKLVEFFEDNHVELYNLREDQAETNDLAAKMPQKADELRQKLHAWRTAVGAQMPTSNPNYDPERNAGRGPAQKKKPDRANKPVKELPEFAIVRGCTLTATKAGYTLATDGEGTALRKADKPFRQRVAFEMKMHTLLKRDEGWQNGFLAFSDSGKDDGLVCAGVFIGGLTVAAFDGLSDSGGQRVAKLAQFDRQKTIDVKVTVDLAKRQVEVLAEGVTVTKPLPEACKTVGYYGYHAMQTRTSFGEITATGE